jgi:hypothetical protein
MIGPATSQSAFGVVIMIVAILGPAVAHRRWAVRSCATWGDGTTITGRSAR